MHLPKRAARLCSYSLLVSLLLAQALATKGQSNSTSPIRGIENFGKVNDNYFRGSQPLADEFAELKKFGIKTVIDLRKDNLKESENLARAAGLQYFNIALTTKQPATTDQTEHFLRLVNAESNWPVFVHCKGGRHRTGQMTAIYRITHDGWTAAQAYEEMKTYDFEDSFFYPRTLKKYVFSYYEKFAQEKPRKSPSLSTAPAQ